MSDSEQFYLTLPSSGGSDVYKGNRPTFYRTDLPELPIDRKNLHDWEVGLAHIQFTHNWDYSTPEFKFQAWVTKFGTGFTQKYPDGYVLSDLETRLKNIGAAQVTSTESASGTPINVTSRLVTVPAYDGWRNVEEFGAHVAKRIEDAFEDDERYNFRVTYERSAANTTLFRVVENSAGGNVYIGISSIDSEMFEILGMTPRRESERLEDKKLKVYLFNERPLLPCVNGFAELETIYVYADICEEQVIGSLRGNLLRIVPVTVRKGVRQCNEYERPQYVRVKPTYLKNILIELRDLTGKVIEIWNQNSMVIVQLHFRRRKREGWS
jgi:hypothetical protein